MIRLIFVATGTDFEDIRYEPPGTQEWPDAKLRENFPGDQVPCLEVNGRKYGQSMAIARFIARETGRSVLQKETFQIIIQILGLAGDDSLQSLKADSIVDFIMDLLNAIWTREWFTFDKAEKEKQWQNMASIIAPRVFKVLNDELTGPYFLGEKLSWADLAFLDAGDWFEQSNIAVIMASFPRLVNYLEVLKNIPILKNYRNNRPSTIF